MIRKGMAVLVALAVAYVAVPAEVTEAQTDTFVGTWVLDVDESNDPREEMRQGREEGAEFVERKGRRGRMGGMRSGRDRGGAAPSEEQLTAGRALVQLAQRTGAVLQLLRSDSTFTVMYPGGETALFFTDKREVADVIGVGVEVKVKAEGKRDEVKVEYRGTGNAKLTRKYKLKDDGRTLEVETQLQNSRMNQSFKFKQVYRRG
jgi:hypothetical protein